MIKNGEITVKLPDSHHNVGEDIMFSANRSAFQRGKIVRRAVHISYVEAGSDKQTLVGEWIHDVLTSTGNVLSVGDTWDSYHSVINRSGSLLTCLQRSKGNYGMVAHVFDVQDEVLKSLYPEAEYLDYTPTAEDLENTDHLFRK